MCAPHPSPHGAVEGGGRRSPFFLQEGSGDGGTAGRGGDGGVCVCVGGVGGVLLNPAGSPKAIHGAGGGWGGQKRKAFFFSSLRFHSASLPNSSGGISNTRRKSSLERCRSSLVLSTPGGSFTLPLFVTISIS